MRNQYHITQIRSLFYWFLQNLFVAGLIWLIVAGTGMCFCLYAKKKVPLSRFWSTEHPANFRFVSLDE